MKIRKLKISELKVNSFTTSIEETQKLLGGATWLQETFTKSDTDPRPVYEITKRMVDGLCWASEVTGPQ